MDSMSDEIFIGTDIVSVPRIAAILKKYPNRFSRHTYTPSEVKYCESMPKPAVHFAGRFAAKEAVKKALLASKAVANLPLKQIEIERLPNGEPVVYIAGKLQNKLNCKVSISHTDEFATATALLSILS